MISPRARGHFILIFTAIRAATADPQSELAAEHIAAARRSIDAALTLVVEKLADDRELEDDAGKEANRLLRGVVDRIREIVVLEKLEQPAHVQTRVLPAIVTLPARTAVDHSLTLLSTANPAAEPTSNEAREVLRFFGVVHRSAAGARLAGATDAVNGHADATVQGRGDVQRQGSLAARAGRRERLYPALYHQHAAGGVAIDAAENQAEPATAGLREVARRAAQRHRGDRKIGNGTVPTRRLTDEDRRLLREICTWASGKSQTMFRTARGFAAYADATRVLARLEGVPETDIEALVEAKFSHVVCARSVRLRG